MPVEHGLDLTQRPLSFKVRKTLRYVRLYGPDRTLAKVRSQYHMRRSYSRLPAQRKSRASQRHVGIIGAGRYAYAQIAYYLTREHGPVIRGVMDTDIHRAASLFERYDLDYYTDDAGELVDDPSIELVYVASNHASHAEYAIRALERGKHAHIEKPHVVDQDQLDRLCAAMEASSGEVALGFNRPKSDLGRTVKRLLDDHSGPAMLNWFVVGHAIPDDHWYNDPAEGGRILGNLCHWSDFTLQLVDPASRLPVRIVPVSFEGSDVDVAVCLCFADGTIAAITFSAKAPPFEGVRERFSAHRGALLLRLDDFQELTYEIAEHKARSRRRTRDHGHRESVLTSYEMARPDGEGGGAIGVDYVRQTGELFLAIRAAVGQGKEITLTAHA